MTKYKITAVLGPTNTGKTHLAIETMLSFDTGMIGFPLRLLAREVYDKIIKKISVDKVALITGEEKIIPSYVGPCRLLGACRSSSGFVFRRYSPIGAQ